MHVDGAYGGAGLAAPSVRELFDGRGPGRQLHRRPAQVALRPVRLLRSALPRPGAGPGRARAERELPRPDRPRRCGTRPTWRSTCPVGLAACLSGSAWPRTAPIAMSRRWSRPWTSRGPWPTAIRSSSHLRLVCEPQLSVLLFERPGWNTDDYRDWSQRMAHEGVILCLPTTWRGASGAAAGLRQPRHTGRTGHRGAGHVALRPSTATRSTDATDWTSAATSFD